MNKQVAADLGISEITVIGAPRQGDAKNEGGLLRRPGEHGSVIASVPLSRTGKKKAADFEGSMGSAPDMSFHPSRLNERHVKPIQVLWEDWRARRLPSVA